MACSISLFPVAASDAEIITRNIELPANQDGPLFRTMFPSSTNLTSADWDEVTPWYIEGLQESLEDPGDELYLKACQIKGQNGDRQLCPVGFCGWEVINRARLRAPTTSPENVEVTKQQPAQNESSPKINTSSSSSSRNVKRRSNLPSALDVDQWVALSNRLRRERQRVLRSLDDSVCRLTFMSVHPDLQKQGIGSMMMQRICEETDRCPGRSAYVLAAPEGVRLYSKFGFEIVGQVETPYGNITSMLRAPFVDEYEADKVSGISLEG